MLLKLDEGITKGKGDLYPNLYAGLLAGFFVGSIPILMGAIFSVIIFLIFRDNSLLAPLHESLPFTFYLLLVYVLGGGLFGLVYSHMPTGNPVVKGYLFTFVVGMVYIVSAASTVPPFLTLATIPMMSAIIGALLGIMFEFFRGWSF